MIIENRNYPNDTLSNELRELIPSVTINIDDEAQEVNIICAGVMSDFEVASCRKTLHSLFKKYGIGDYKANFEFLGFGKEDLN